MLRTHALYINIRKKHAQKYINVWHKKNKYILRPYVSVHRLRHRVPPPAEIFGETSLCYATQYAYVVTIHHQRK